MKTLFTRTAIAAAAATALTTPALASPAISATSFVFDFSYEKEAAETTAGAETIYDDLKAQVAEHCDVDTYPLARLNKMQEQQCIERTMDRAVNTIDTPAMDAAHDAATT
ncbi:MAG: UrcA family protein [Pseudomonadota bacterium]